MIFRAGVHASPARSSSTRRERRDREPSITDQSSFFLRANGTDQRTMASTLLHFFALAFFPALMALSASMDLLTFTIPNRISALVSLLDISSWRRHSAFRLRRLFSTSLAPWRSWRWRSSCSILAGSAAGTPSSRRRLPLWLGWSSILAYGVIAAICGGILTLIILSARMAPLPVALGRFVWIARLHDCKSGVPYGDRVGVGGIDAISRLGRLDGGSLDRTRAKRFPSLLRRRSMNSHMKVTSNAREARRTFFDFDSDSFLFYPSQKKAY